MGRMHAPGLVYCIIIFVVDLIYQNPEYFFSLEVSGMNLL